MYWNGPEDEMEETGFEIGENVGHGDSPDDVHDGRLMDARPTGITLPEENKSPEDEE